MICRIKTAAPSCRSALNYNDEKVARGNAEIIACANCAEDSYRESFAALERGSIRTEKMSFHMSVNPEPSEDASLERITSYIDDVMKGLGYGDQPYVVYRHHDIDRMHFHVVSCRVREDGHKVPDSYEERRLMSLMESLGKDYGYAVGRSDDETKELHIDTSCFNPRLGHTVEQMDAIFRECMTYKFTTFHQLELILEHHGIRGSFCHDGEGNMRMNLQGLDASGNPCTGIVDERDTLTDMYRSYEMRALACRDPRRTLSKNEWSQFVMYVRWAAENSRSESHFVSMLSKRDIQVDFKRDSGGVIAGTTFISHIYKEALKGSDLKGQGFDLSASYFASLEKDGRWSSGSEGDASAGQARTEQETPAQESLSAGDFVPSMSMGRSKGKDPKDDDPLKRRRKGQKL